MRVVPQIHSVAVTTALLGANESYRRDIILPPPPPSPPRAAYNMSGIDGMLTTYFVNTFHFFMILFFVGRGSVSGVRAGLSRAWLARRADRLRVHSPHAPDYDDGRR